MGSENLANRQGSYGNLDHYLWMSAKPFKGRHGNLIFFCLLFVLFEKPNPDFFVWSLSLCYTPPPNLPGFLGLMGLVLVKANELYLYDCKWINSNSNIHHLLFVHTDNLYIRICWHKPTASIPIDPCIFIISKPIKVIGKHIHSVAKVYAVLPFYDVKCLCSGGREESHSH